MAVLSFSSYSQPRYYNAKVTFAIETFAFLKGQDAALEKIAGQFPGLSADVRAAEKKLDEVYGQAQYNIKEYLKKEVEHHQLQKFQQQLDSLLDLQLQQPIEKESHARGFLMQVTERPASMCDSALSKGILSFKYHNEPHQEILDGHIAFFQAKDHPKAGNGSMSVPIPASWLAEEAEMPQTIQQFTSCYGNGTEKIFLVVHDLPAAYGNTVADQNSMMDFLSPDATLLRSEMVSIDGMPALMTEVEEPVPSGHKEMKIRMLQFLIIKNQKLYCIQGSTLPAVSTENLEPQIKKNERLFRLIAARTELD